jgi:hypothetical protein
LAPLSGIENLSLSFDQTTIILSLNLPVLKLPKSKDEINVKLITASFSLPKRDVNVDLNHKERRKEERIIKSEFRS